jgi:hypothetical protein
MAHYVISFILAFWGPIPFHSHRGAEVRAIAADIASTDCRPLECLEIANIAALESGFERAAIGKLGEVGAFQNLHGDPSAKAALKLLRTQRMLGYVGCPTETESCMHLVANRTVKAIVFNSSHPYEQ